jgi:hypothetical protein
MPTLGPTNRQPVAWLAWSSAPRHIGSRDRYVGWSGEARRRKSLAGLCIIICRVR